MRVLMIDDHALFRMGLSELLERRGIEVVAALGDCKKGIQWVEENRRMWSCWICGCRS